MHLLVLIALTLFAWSVCSIFDKKALQRASNSEVLLTLYLCYLLALPLFVVILHATKPGWHLSAGMFAWSALSAIASAIAMAAYTFALSKKDASYVVGITSSYPFVLQILAAFMLHETLQPARLVGALFIAIGVGAIASVERRMAKPTDGKQIWVTAALAIAVVAWGFYGIFDKLALNLADPLLVFFAQNLSSAGILSVALAGLWVKGERPRLLNAHTWKWCALTAAFTGVGAWSYLNALSISSASYVLAITGAYPALMYLLSLIFLQEQFNKARLAGIGCVAIGSALIQLAGSAATG